jgi:acetylornithine/succinyldiaminopimelate/putrescine aminotransferase
MCLAKALAGGLPMGACLARPEIASAFQVGDHATTFGGGPVQAAAAVATLDVIEEEGLVENAADMGELLTKGLREILGGRAEVRGLGLLIGVAFEADIARDIAASALDKGLLVNDVTPSVVRLSPPLTIDAADVERALEVLEEVDREAAAA